MQWADPHSPEDPSPHYGHDGIRIDAEGRRPMKVADVMTREMISACIGVVSEADLLLKQVSHERAASIAQRDPAQPMHR